MLLSFCCSPKNVGLTGHHHRLIPTRHLLRFSIHSSVLVVPNDVLISSMKSLPVLPLPFDRISRSNLDPIVLTNPMLMIPKRDMLIDLIYRNHSLSFRVLIACVPCAIVCLVAGICAGTERSSERDGSQRCVCEYLGEGRQHSRPEESTLVQNSDFIRILSC
jgi:hypothetical protein